MAVASQNNKNVRLLAWALDADVHRSLPFPQQPCGAKGVHKDWGGRRAGRMEGAHLTTWIADPRVDAELGALRLGEATPHASAHESGRRWSFLSGCGEDDDVVRIRRRKTRGGGCERYGCASHTASHTVDKEMVQAVKQLPRPAVLPMRSSVAKQGKWRLHCKVFVRPPSYLCLSRSGRHFTRPLHAHHLQPRSAPSSKE